MYEIVDAHTEEVLSRHRTRQAAVDTWRLTYSGRPIRVYREQGPNSRKLIVEGTWYESQRGA
jgi:hypothetical protein